MPRPFANLDGLVRLSRTEGIDVRRPLLRVLTDLYVQEANHTREEEQQYIELALRLLPDVDVATRTVVACKLNAYANAPAAVLEAILRDTPDVAALLEGPESANGDEAGIVESFLAATPTRDSHAGGSILPAVIEAQATTLRPYRSDRQETLGEAFLQMTPTERARFLEGLEGTESEDAGESLNLPPRPGARRRLESAALQRNRSEFARELQLALGIPPRVAWRVAQDSSGELILVAAKALEMRIDVVVRVLLILNPAIGESVERVFTLTGLYERLLPEAVMPIVFGWRAEAAARTAVRFQSMHAGDVSEEAGRARESGRAVHDDAARRSRPSDTGAPLRRQDAS